MKNVSKFNNTLRLLTNSIPVPRLICSRKTLPATLFYDMFFVDCMSEKRREKGKCTQIFLPEIPEPTWVGMVREDRLLGSMPRERVTDLAYQGPTLPDGSVNYDCTCTGSLPFGPCGTVYRQAMTCFKQNEHLSDDALAENCGIVNTIWRNCMDRHWKIYYPQAATAKQRHEQK